MPKRLEEVPVFEELNHTELWQMAKRLGIEGASPAASREEIIEVLRNLDHLELDDPIDKFREEFSTWLVDNWDRLQMQVQKDHCPNCHLSSDMEMADCWLDNHHRVI